MKKEKPTREEKVKKIKEKPIKEKRIKPMKARKERFEVLKMWISVLTSAFTKDMGSIPKNIGNRVLITNNSYVTKNYMSSILCISNLSSDTPRAFIECMAQALRDAGSSALMDVSFRLKKQKIDLEDGGIRSRLRGWENTLKVPDAATDRKVNAAECILTYEEARKGTRLLTGRIFVTLRAKTSSQLTLAEQAIIAFVLKYKGDITSVTSDTKDVMKHVLLMSHSNNTKNVDKYGAMTLSYKTLAQMMPNTGSTNDYEGAWVGVDIENGSQYLIDFANITSARNIYVYAPSGGGKTVIATNIAQSLLEQEFAGIVTDVKGNEFNNLVNSVNGLRISLADDSTEYINFFKLHANDVKRNEAVAYYNNRINASKTTIEILSGVKSTDKGYVTLLNLIDAFLTSFYIQLGVEPSNPGTWDRTLNVTPFIVYENLEQFAVAYLKNNGDDISIGKTLIASLRQYWTKSGAMSHAFLQEFDYKSILEAPMISFALCILQQTDVRNNDLLRLKYFYMSKLNSAYSSNKFAEGKKIVCIMEESQYVSLDSDMTIADFYLQNWTLGRSRNQTNLLLGNSLEALFRTPKMIPMVENMTGLLLGPNIVGTTQEVIVEQFKLSNIRQYLGRDSKNGYANTFLFVNRMQDKENVPIIKVPIPSNRSIGNTRYKVLRPDEVRSI